MGSALSGARHGLVPRPRRLLARVPAPLRGLGGALVQVVLVGWATLVMLLIVAALAFPFFCRGHYSGAPTCSSNLKQLSTAFLMYAEDYDGRLPPADSWGDGLFPYVKNRDVYACPTRPRMKSGYAFDLLMDRRVLSKVPFPEKQPALFESTLNRPNAADLLESFVRPHVEKGNVAFADGHVKALPDAPAADAGLSPSPFRAVSTSGTDLLPGEREVLRLRDYGGACYWLGNEDALWVRQDPKGSWDTARVNLNTGETERLGRIAPEVSQPGPWPWQPSPDGKWLLRRIDSRTGSRWLLQSTDGRSWRALKAAGAGALWVDGGREWAELVESPAGARLQYRDLRGRSLREVALPDPAGSWYPRSEVEGSRLLMMNALWEQQGATRFALITLGNGAPGPSVFEVHWPDLSQLADTPVVDPTLQRIAWKFWRLPRAGAPGPRGKEPPKLELWVSGLRGEQMRCVGRITGPGLQVSDSGQGFGMQWSPSGRRLMIERLVSADLWGGAVSVLEL